MRQMGTGTVELHDGVVKKFGLNADPDGWSEDHWGDVIELDEPLSQEERNSFNKVASEESEVFVGIHFATRDFFGKAIIEDMGDASGGTWRLVGLRKWLSEKEES